MPWHEKLIGICFPDAPQLHQSLPSRLLALATITMLLALNALAGDLTIRRESRRNRSCQAKVP